MPTISLTLPNDGETIDATDVNTPFTQIATLLNGSLDDSNIASVSGTKVTSASVAPSKLTDAANPEKRWDEGLFDFVASGCVWSGDSYGSTLLASMTAGVVYVNGKRLVISSVSARAFTASKDTYVYVNDSGALTYTETSNNASSPSLPANSMLLAIIVTGASSIADAGSVNQGQTNKILPIASSVPYAVTDSNGNKICNRDPTSRILGYRQITSAFSTSSGTPTQVTGLSCPVVVPTGRQVRITAFTSQLGDPSNNNTNVLMGVWDGVVNVGTQLTQANLGQMGAAVAGRVGQVAHALTNPSAGAHTYNVGAWSGGTANLDSSGAYPAFIMVELA